MLYYDKEICQLIKMINNYICYYISKYKKCGDRIDIYSNEKC